MTRPHSGEWAVLLAGGDGIRLRSLTARIEGDLRPKQFSRVIGEDSLLSQTRRRILPLFESQRTMAVVTKKHEPFYSSQLNDLPSRSLLIQPENRGTGIAIAAAVAILLEEDPDAIAAFFPCDHHYANEPAFLDTVRAGLSAVRNNPDMIVLFGAAPTHPETDYGWIEPEQTDPASELQPARIRRFWEKPAPAIAQQLLQCGCLWNTFVTMGKARAFLNLICAAVPDAMTALSAELIEGNCKPSYGTIPFVDFSRDVLADQVDRLLVIRDTASGWTDLGRPSRVFETLARQRAAPTALHSIPHAVSH